MEDFVNRWVFDPNVGKIVAAIVSILIITVLVRFAQRSVSRYIKNDTIRYRVRKFITFIGYVLGIFAIATVFSDKLGGLTVAFGVAGAGIAFALQAVIASIAGWFAISFANFYKSEIAFSWAESRGMSLISVSCAPR